jgi:hypothetical protein
MACNELLFFAKRHRERLHEHRVFVDDLDAADVASDVGGYAPQSYGAEKGDADTEQSISEESRDRMRKMGIVENRGARTKTREMSVEGAAD